MKVTVEFEQSELKLSDLVPQKTAVHILRNFMKNLINPLKMTLDYFDIFDEEKTEDCDCEYCTDDSEHTWYCIKITRPGANSFEYYMTEPEIINLIDNDEAQDELLTNFLNS